MNTIPTESVWHRYRQNQDLLTRNQIARLNDNLARKIAHRMSGQSAEPIEDLTQLARIGLLKAIERYDPEAGAAFSSFAVPYIQGEILHFLRDHFGSIKIPRRAYEEVSKVKNAALKLESMGRKVSHVEVAVAIGISRQKWEWLTEATQRKQLADLDDQHHLSGEDESEEIDLQHEYDKLKLAIAHFPRLKRLCVEEYWFKGMSEASIARLHKLPLQQVEALLSEAFEQLKSQLLGA